MGPRLPIAFRCSIGADNHSASAYLLLDDSLSVPIFAERSAENHATSPMSGSLPRRSHSVLMRCTIRCRGSLHGLKPMPSDIGNPAFTNEVESNLSIRETTWSLISRSVAFGNAYRTSRTMDQRPTWSSRSSSSKDCFKRSVMSMCVYLRKVNLRNWNRRNINVDRRAAMTGYRSQPNRSAARYVKCGSWVVRPRSRSCALG